MTDKEVLTAFRVVHPDFASSRGYVWPFPGGRATAPGPIITSNTGGCPEQIGDGLCLAKTWKGAASGGIPASTVLICTYTAADVLGEDDNKIRVSACDVIRVVDVQRIYREYRTDPDLPADLSSANLRSAKLSSANLSSAKLYLANLSSANLSSANLSSANLSLANLSSANLSSANLSLANLSLANLSSANLSSANLSSADLSSAYALDHALNVDKAYGDEFTQLPPGWSVSPAGLIVRSAK